MAAHCPAGRVVPHKETRLGRALGTGFGGEEMKKLGNQREGVGLGPSSLRGSDTWLN